MLTIRQRAIKRAFDLVVAVVALALVWPVIVMAAAIARAETGEPGFFRQIRVGRHGRHFRIWKIRTMRTDPARTSAVTVAGDPGITRSGHVLRRTKIDELPQLLNVLRGDMSIVGPRPDVPGFHDRLEGDDRIVLSVRPGITGPAALRFRDEERVLATVADPATHAAGVLFPRKIAIDRAYVAQYRLTRDVAIMLATLACVLPPWRSVSHGGEPASRATLVSRRWGMPLSMVDQGVSSLTNLLVSLVAARSLTSRGFGVFAMAFVCYLMVLGVTRGVTSEPLVVRHSSAGAHAQRSACDDALGATVTVALVVVAALCVAALLVPGDLAVALVGLALVLPGLLVQDTLRFVAVTSGRVGEAVRNDLVWFACGAAALWLTVLVGWSHAVVLLIAWGGGATVAGLVSARRMSAHPRPAHGRRWLGAHWDIGGRFAGEFLALQGSGQLAFSLVAVAGGLSELAALQGANVLFGPFNVLVMGLRQLSVPGLVRARARAPERLRHALASVSAVTTVAAVFIGAVVLMVPEGVGRQVLGATWSSARDLAVPVTVHKAVIGLGLGSLCALRVHAAARESLRTQLATGAAFVVAGPLGALLGGAAGAAWGMAAAQAAGSTLYMLAYRRVGERREQCVSFIT